MIIVAGHICLDIFPSFDAHWGGLQELMVPGKLVNVGPALLSTGGAVSNAGLALHRLGIPSRLMGMVGDDLFGHAILDVLRRHDASLADDMIVNADVSSSYTFVLSPPGVDRIFFHCPGANDTFSAEDIVVETFGEASIFHFGYPPIMRRMYRHEGAELETLFRRVKSAGLTTSLDMTLPDPDAEAGNIDWKILLRRVLPHVDLFLPSIDEILYMLDRPRFDELQARRRTAPFALVDGALLKRLATQLIEMGVAVAGLKLGDQGLYVHTSRQADRLEVVSALGPALAEVWRDRELLAPCFQVAVTGTTGAGDCAIAGFLAGLIKKLPLESVMTGAVAVGACNVESPDATSGVPPWQDVQLRIHSGWQRRDVTISLDGWTWDADASIWIGPHDAFDNRC